MSTEPGMSIEPEKSIEPGMSIEGIVFRLVEDMLGVREVSIYTIWISVILSHEINLRESQVTLESTLIDDLGADELDLAELMMALEERLDVQIPDEVMEQFRTVGDIVDFVQSQTGE
ncbi:hypothetical protein BJX62DRAFT_238177 [Aspergillus germanicus]